MAKKRGLSKGLDALLGGVAALPKHEVTIAETPAAEEGSSAPIVDGDLRRLPIEFMQPGRYQPRKDMHPEALEELAKSIKSQGVMQPIVVRPIGDRKYEIIAGERRWRASQMAELDVIPVIIRDVPDEAAIAMALIENIQREDLNPMEEAVALQRLQDEFELTHQQVADAVGKSRATVTNLLRLMSLAPETKTLLEHGDIEMGHARALLSLKADEQNQTARQVAAKGLSVRQTEALVRKLQTGDEAPKRPASEDPNVKKLIADLTDKLSAPVQIQANAKGKGKLVVSFSSLDELDGILAHIK